MNVPTKRTSNCARHGTRRTDDTLTVTRSGAPHSGQKIVNGTAIVMRHSYALLWQRSHECGQQLAHGLPSSCGSGHAVVMYQCPSSNSKLNRFS